MDLYDLKNKTTRDNLKITSSLDPIFSFIYFSNVNYWYEEDRYDADNNDTDNQKSLSFLMALKKIYGKHRVFTKPIQKIKHYLNEQEIINNTRTLQHDKGGDFIRIPKCNFDVEICVDAIKLIEKYKTFCIFSSDADFVHLARFLKNKGKKIILVKGGHVHHSLRQIADLVISAQEIKRHITIKKQKPGR